MILAKLYKKERYNHHPKPKSSSTQFISTHHVTPLTHHMMRNQQASKQSHLALLEVQNTHFSLTHKLLPQLATQGTHKTNLPYFFLTH